MAASIGRDLWKYSLPVKLILFDTEAKISDPTPSASRAYWIADDSHTQVWQYDGTAVYVPFESIQKDMGMEAQQVTSDLTGQTLTRPARTHEIHVRIKRGVDLLARPRHKIQDVDRSRDGPGPRGGADVPERRFWSATPGRRRPGARARRCDRPSRTRRSWSSSSSASSAWWPCS